jgi:hypothetical protein
MESQEVSITPACKLVGSPGDELCFLSTLVEKRIAPGQDQKGHYRITTRLKIKT